MIVWPSSLPQCPIVGTWQESPQPNVLAFQPDVGKPITRRNSTAKVWLTSCRFLLSSEQRRTFLEFFDYDCFDGALPFYWNHPETKAQYRWQFDPESPPVFTPYTMGVWELGLSLVRLRD